MKKHFLFNKNSSGFSHLFGAAAKYLRKTVPFKPNPLETNTDARKTGRETESPLSS